MGGVLRDWEEGLGRARTTLTSPGGCDKTGMEPFSGREIWPWANVNVLEELMHRTLICSSSARWRHVWETGRVSEWIPNTLRVPRKPRACLLLQGGEGCSGRNAKGGRTPLSFSAQWRRHGAGTSSALDTVLVPHTSPQMVLLPAQREGEYVHGADEKTKISEQNLYSGFSPPKYPSVDEKFNGEGMLGSICLDLPLRGGTHPPRLLLQSSHTLLSTYHVMASPLPSAEPLDTLRQIPPQP